MLQFFSLWNTLIKNLSLCSYRDLNQPRVTDEPSWAELRNLPFRANSCPEISPIKRLLLDAKHVCWSQGSPWFSADTQWFSDNPWDIIILSVRPECPPSYWQQDLARAEGSRTTEQVACHKWRMLQRKAEWMAIRCIKCIKIPRTSPENEINECAAQLPRHIQRKGRQWLANRSSISTAIIKCKPESGIC